MPLTDSIHASPSRRRRTTETRKSLGLVSVLPELVDGYGIFWHVGEIQGLVPLGGSVVIIPFDSLCRFLKANVIESGERGSVDVFDGVIGYEEHLFPSHEHKVGVVEHVVVERVQVESFGVLKEAEEFAPMLSIHLFVGVPFPCQKWKLVADDFSHETRRQRTELFR